MSLKLTVCVLVFVVYASHVEARRSGKKNKGQRFCHYYDLDEYAPSRDTWEKARKHCQRKGGDLVQIGSPNEDYRVNKMLEDVINKGNGDGWYIGAKYVNGEWRMADGSPMWYTNFPKYVQEAFMMSDSPSDTARITNFAAIFYDVTANGYETYNWGYVSPRDRSKLGTICEIKKC
ncbi:uncharacterized protein LOC134691701 [Mytilus trossulus]|uniref:uncharacterized protein LOC134691701 n=1 Tax=Mytilus trossulus TaxID=6551 RepID=UPI00300740FA